MDCVWKVFIPHRLSYSENGYLVGCVWTHEQRICVTGVILLEDFNNKGNKCNGCYKVSNKQEESYPSPQIIGSWTVDEDLRIDRETFRSKKGRTEWLELELLHPQTLTARVYTDYSSVEFCSSTCILFDPDDLQMSYFIQEKTLAESEGCSPLNVAPSTENDECGPPNIIPCSVVKIVQGIHQNSAILNHWKKSHNMIDYFMPSPCLQISVLDWITAFSILPVRLLCLLFPFVHFRVGNKYINKILFTPAFMGVLQTKHSQIQSHCQGNTRSPLKTLCYFDLGCRQIVDSLLGVMCLLIISKLALSQDIASLILSWTQTTVTSLSRILQWLMGSPAGLKLNSQLNGFLGSFFKYNIYVWTTYLTVILRPILGTFLQCCMFSGIFGLSLQLSLLQDIISLMTLHIYCFYVFASRLYYFQVYALSSLWRLFRGKKWNVLRKRLDTASYDIDRLFVGTLLFTILLFLLPTIVVYYTLFTVLQLIILVFQSCLSTVIICVTCIPVYSLLQWLIRAKSVAGHVIFRVHSCEESSNNTLTLAMQVSQFSLGQVISQFVERTSKDNLREAHSIWSGIVKKITKGHLIWKLTKKEK